MATFSIAQSGSWDGASYTSADIKQQSQVSSVPFTTRETSEMSLVKTSARDSKWQLHSSITRKHGGYPLNSSTRTRYDAAALTLWLSRVFQTPKFKKWDAGEEPRSRSISGSSSLATRRE